MGTAAFYLMRADRREGCRRLKTFTYEVDRFEDISVLKYRLPGFEQLSAGREGIHLLAV
ncbi:MAG: hypothetical protein MZV63_09180 [Marinilabiliales bacterium]|nr:hypothetical protein [Marinilabiliales bacterium]